MFSSALALYVQLNTIVFPFQNDWRNHELFERRNTGAFVAAFPKSSIQFSSILHTQFMTSKFFLQVLTIPNYVRLCCELMKVT